MNTPILARDVRVDERNVEQGSGRELSRKISSPRPESWRAKLLGATFAALILTSATLISSGTGDLANAGGDGALLYPAGNLTRVAAAHVGGTTHRDTLGADKTTTHGPLIAGRHLAWSAKRAG
jgi:hypothetical protein